MTPSGHSRISTTSGRAAAAGRAPRSLFLTLDPAWPAVSGVDLRNWQNATAAATLGSVALASVTAAVETPPSAVAIYSLTARPEGSVWRQAPTLAQADLLVPTEADDALRRAIADFVPDTLVVEHPALVDLALASRDRAPAMRIVVDLHNIESVSDARTASTHAFVNPRRWRAARAARGSARAERRIAAVADAVWVCSREEEARLRSLAGAVPPVHVVPNGIPRLSPVPGALEPIRPVPNGDVTLVLAAHLGYPPNVDAARRLARRILPAVWKRLNARLVLAGRSPARAVRALADLPGVRVIADPVDMVPILAAADIAVLPLRLGGGTRIKAAEAMSRGLPVVATRFAVEGLDLTEGIHFLAAETTQDFVEAISALAADPAARSRLREAAWSHGIDKFGPEAINRAVRAGLTPP
jgi:glycosyltransferase involved in cell wall biosynthesis